MDYTSLVISAIVLAIGGSFLFKRVKYGSWTGAFLSGTIRRTVGEVTLNRMWMTNCSLTVNAMENADSAEQFVGLVLTTRVVMAAKTSPCKLTKEQALDLSRMLQEAAK